MAKFTPSKPMKEYNLPEEADRYLVKLDSEELLRRTHIMWDLSGSLPIPKFNTDCSTCFSDNTFITQWVFHSRSYTVATHCDVFFRCGHCLKAWTHGIAVPGDYQDGKYGSNVRTNNLLRRD